MSAKKNVLVVGSGAREHGLGWKLAQSSQVGDVFFAPGNAGTASVGHNVDLSDDIEATMTYCLFNDITLVVVGPEGPLAEGIVDCLEEVGIAVFGPSKQAAQLEASKAFAKTFMDDFNIPTARFQIFDDLSRALVYVRQQTYPLFVKASGLAGGKGAIPCHTVREAEVALLRIMRSEKYGTAGREVVIERFLDGPELSMHVLSDGKTCKVLPYVQDYKQIGPNAFGLPETLNTGGMGATGPFPVSQILAADLFSIAHATLSGIRTRGAPFKGCLYPGFKLTDNGPKVLEYNVRFGDPEAQVLMRLLKSDLFELLFACATGTLADVAVEWDNDLHAACIVLTSGGYPEKYETGFPISGLNLAAEVPGVEIFHAGTAVRGCDIVTNGGRVLSVTAVGKTLAEAISRADHAAECVDFEGIHYRRNIGAGVLLPA